MELRPQSVDGIDFTARLHAREDQLTVRVPVVREDSFDLFNLILVQAFRSGIAVAEHSRGIKLAQGWVLDNAVFNLVDLITLTKHLIVDPCLPRCRGNEVGASSRARDGVEAGALGN
jgi:hypothetical protein